jgi:threonine dehydratase
MAGDAPEQVFVQVGGGALASCVGAALGPGVTLRPVQATGCAPLARAVVRAEGMAEPERRWHDVMTPWEHPASLADGILDDETYDWIGVLQAMRASGGSPVVTTESDIAEAHRLAHLAGFDASHTGSAGLAGLLTARATVPDGARVAVVMSGIQR